VTTALSELNRAGRIARLPHGWLLRGDPPAATAAPPAPRRRSRAALRAVDAASVLGALPTAGSFLG
jgi:hypothetical protein